MASTDYGQEQQKVQIRLSTQDASISLPTDPGLLLIGTNFRRITLSSLVNNLLQSEKPVPFEFLINGQFLRTTIDEFLTANGISAETVLTVEYTRALIPPLHVTSFEHDDWVSAIDVLSNTSPPGKWAGGDVGHGEERILSASYDGLLRIWNTSGSVLATSTQPSNGGRLTSLKSAKFLSPSKLVAGGMDTALRIYDYTTNSDSQSASITPTLELYAHKWSIEDVAVHTPSSRILTASSDNTVGFWSSKASEVPSAPADLLPNANTASNKRLKMSKPAKSIRQGGALALLSGHMAPVQSVIFAPNDATVAYSAAQDHTVRTWDLPTATLVDTRTTAHPLFSLACLEKLNLLATGSSARHITLIDPRASAAKVSVMTLRGHTNSVVSLATNPESEYGLLSGSHDGTCRVWDIRSVRTGVAGEGQVGESVYVIERDSAKGARRAAGEGVKVFDVAWDRGLGIVSGGEDKRVQINGRG